MTSTAEEVEVVVVEVEVEESNTDVGSSNGDSNEEDEEASFSTAMANPVQWWPLDTYQSHVHAGVFLFLWVVFDCADGQVARLCGRGTRTGRILDGMVDCWVVVACLMVVRNLMDEQYGYGTWWTYIAGYSMWWHTLTYDKLKNIFSERVLGEGECVGETPEGVYQELMCARGIDVPLLRFYYHYTSLQRWMHPAPPHHSYTKQECQAFAQRHRGTMRLASFLGLSAHVVGLYVAFFATYYMGETAILALHFYYIVILNILCLVVGYQSRTMSKVKGA